MPQITLIGINHKTAPVALREILSFTGDEADIALHRLFQKPEIGELVLFSTCNRMEILFIPVQGMVKIVSKHSFPNLNLFPLTNLKTPFTPIQEMRPSNTFFGSPVVWIP